MCCREDAMSHPDELNGTTDSGAQFRLCFRDCEQHIAGDLAGESVSLVVTGPPWFKHGQAYENPEETWDEHWRKRRRMLDQSLQVLKPGGKLVLHLADCPVFEWQTGLTEEKLIPAIYADYLREQHQAVLWHRFILVEPQPWTHYQHAKRVALPSGEVQVLADADYVADRMRDSSRPAMDEQPRLGWTYLLVFRKPGPVTASELRELACLGWKAAMIAPAHGELGTDVELPSVSEEERSYYRRAVWRFPPSAYGDPDREVGTHRCPWPRDLPHRLIRMYSNEGDWVLDPYVGVGTTVEAALPLARSVIGYEDYPDYVELLRRRFGPGNL